MAIEIVDVPIKNGDFPLLFVCSPEGNELIQMIQLRSVSSVSYHNCFLDLKWDDYPTKYFIIFIGEGLKPGGRDIRRCMGQHPAIREHEKAIAAIQPTAEFFFAVENQRPKFSQGAFL